MKTILVIGGVVASLLLGACVYGVSSFDGVVIRDSVRAELSAQTGRLWSIEQDAELKFGLRPVVVLQGLSAPNAPWATRPDLLTLERVAIESDWWSIISGAPALHSLEFSGLQLNLETDGDGNNNVDDAPRVSGDPSARSAPGKFSALQDIILKDTVVRLRLGWAEVENTYPIELVHLRTLGAVVPVALTMNAQFKDRPVVISGELGSPQAIVGNKPFKVDLAGHYDGVESEAELGLKGRIGALAGLADMNLKFTLTADALNDIPSISGLQLPRDTPVSITAALVNTGQGPQLDDYILRIGQAIIRPGDGP